jgi:hypothetical protein
VTLRKPGFANRCALLPAHCSRWLAGTGDPRITQITRRHFIVFELPVQLSSRHSDGGPGVASIQSTMFVCYDTRCGILVSMARSTRVNFPGSLFSSIA